jgi:hypothetical protein
MDGCVKTSLGEVFWMEMVVVVGEEGDGSGGYAIDVVDAVKVAEHTLPKVLVAVTLDFDVDQYPRLGPVLQSHLSEYINTPLGCLAFRKEFLEFFV